MHKIPVTIITGFLGAGKTTLIRQLLQNPDGRRIAVLVNEFGEVGIDGDLLRSCQVCDDEDGAEAPVTNILELTNGCLCCTVQEEFLPTMQVLMERRDQIDCIVIETSGLALPKPLVQAFSWPEIRTAATVDSCAVNVIVGRGIPNNIISITIAINICRRSEHHHRGQHIKPTIYACSATHWPQRSRAAEGRAQLRQ